MSSIEEYFDALTENRGIDFDDTEELLTRSCVGGPRPSHRSVRPTCRSACVPPVRP